MNETTKYYDAHEDVRKYHPKRGQIRALPADRKRIIFRNEFGKYHNLNGPSIIHKNGNVEWFVDGVRHRLDGPAAIRWDCKIEWWVNGQLHNDYGPAVVYKMGTRMWYKHGELHNSNGPAATYRNGTCGWYIHDKCVNDVMEKWMNDRGVESYPWDEDTEIQFRLDPPI